MMVYYLLLPIFSLFLVVLQGMISDVIFSGHVILEVSLIVVIYFGFRFDLIRGAISSSVLGFMFDCISGSILGLFTIIYILVFLFSFFVSARLITEKVYIIALFTFFCVLLEEFMAFMFFDLAFGFEVLRNTPVTFWMFQALLVGLFAPVFFYLMRRVEVFFYGKPAQSAQWTGTNRISAED